MIVSAHPPLLFLSRRRRRPFVIVFAVPVLVVFVAVWSHRRTLCSAKEYFLFFYYCYHTVMPTLPAYKNYFSLFSFFLVPLYVGYVLASDNLDICCFVWRYEFSSKF